MALKKWLNQKLIIIETDSDAVHDFDRLYRLDVMLTPITEIDQQQQDGHAP